MTDSVSPLAALDVSAARRLLEDLAENAEVDARALADDFAVEDAQALTHNAALIRQVSAALASLPALLADGARLAALREKLYVNGTVALPNREPTAAWLELGYVEIGLNVETVDQALDELVAARAVRPAGAAPESVNE